MFSPSHGVPFWHLTGVPMKRRICISNAGRAFLLGLLSPPLCSAVIFSVVYLFFFHTSSWLFDYFQMQVSGMFTEWGREACLTLPLWGWLKRCDARLSAVFVDMFEYKWQPLQHADIKSEEEENPDGISDGGPLCGASVNVQYCRFNFFPFILLHWRSFHHNAGQRHPLFCRHLH